MASSNSDGLKKLSVIVGALLLLIFLGYMAIFGNFSTMPIITHSSNTSSYQNQIQRATQQGYYLNTVSFYCASSSACNRVQITPCGNNVPSQYICINSANLSNFQNQTQIIRNRSGDFACPMFYEVGNISCGCSSNYCTESYNR